MLVFPLSPPSLTGGPGFRSPDLGRPPRLSVGGPSRLGLDFSSPSKLGLGRPSRLGPPDAGPELGLEPGPLLVVTTVAEVEVETEVAPGAGVVACAVAAALVRPILKLNSDPVGNPPKVNGGGVAATVEGLAVQEAVAVLAGGRVNGKPPGRDNENTLLFGGAANRFGVVTVREPPEVVVVKAGGPEVVVAEGALNRSLGTRPPKNTPEPRGPEVVVDGGALNRLGTCVARRPGGPEVAVAAGALNRLGTCVPKSPVEPGPPKVYPGGPEEVIATDVLVPATEEVSIGARKRCSNFVDVFPGLVTGAPN